MNFNLNKSRVYYFEFLLQLGLLALVFVFYTYERDNFEIARYEIASFLNYTIAAYIISYGLLSRFLYKNKYLLFFLFFLAIVAIVIYVEEAIIEQIFFPESKGKYFLGIFFNLAETLPIISIITGFKFAWDVLTKQSEVEQLKSTVQESELLYLKSQINPHFLFNNLNNLYSYALEKSSKTPEIILQLSSVLRYILYGSRESYVPVSKEISHLNDYIKLSKLQFEDRGDVRFNQTVESTNFDIAPLILPVFIENAFKHSSSSQSKKIIIQVELILSKEGLLQFNCKNSFAEQSNTENLTKGIGLKNVKRRLEILYPNSHKLDIDITDDTYNVLLELQLKQEKHELHNN